MGGGVGRCIGVQVVGQAVEEEEAFLLEDLFCLPGSGTQLWFVFKLIVGEMHDCGLMCGWLGFVNEKKDLI